MNEEPFLMAGFGEEGGVYVNAVGWECVLGEPGCVNAYEYAPDGSKLTDPGGTVESN